MSKMTWEELEASFDELLDDIYPVIKIGEATFYPSQILKTCDPIAYQIGVSEHEDYLAEEDN